MLIFCNMEKSPKKIRKRGSIPDSTTLLYWCRDCECIALPPTASPVSVVPATRGDYSCSVKPNNAFSPLTTHTLDC